MKNLKNILFVTAFLLISTSFLAQTTQNANNPAKVLMDKYKVATLEDVEIMDLPDMIKMWYDVQETIAKQPATKTALTPLNDKLVFVIKGENPKFNFVYTAPSSSLDEDIKKAQKLKEIQEETARIQAENQALKLEEIKTKEETARIKAETQALLKELEATKKLAESMKSTIKTTEKNKKK